MNPISGLLQNFALRLPNGGKELPEPLPPPLRVDLFQDLRGQLQKVAPGLFELNEAGARWTSPHRVEFDVKALADPGKKEFTCVVTPGTLSVCPKGFPASGALTRGMFTGMFTKQGVVHGPDGHDYFGDHVLAPGLPRWTPMKGGIVDVSLQRDGQVYGVRPLEEERACELVRIERGEVAEVLGRVPEGGFQSYAVMGDGSAFVLGADFSELQLARLEKDGSTTWTPILHESDDFRNGQKLSTVAVSPDGDQLWIHVDRQVRYAVDPKGASSDGAWEAKELGMQPLRAIASSYGVLFMPDENGGGYSAVGQGPGSGTYLTPFDREIRQWKEPIRLSDVTRTELRVDGLPGMGSHFPGWGSVETIESVQRTPTGVMLQFGHSKGYVKDNSYVPGQTFVTKDNWSVSLSTKGHVEVAPTDALNDKIGLRLPPGAPLGLARDHTGAACLLMRVEQDGRSLGELYRLKHSQTEGWSWNQLPLQASEAVQGIQTLWHEDGHSRLALVLQEHADGPVVHAEYLGTEHGGIRPYVPSLGQQLLTQGGVYADAEKIRRQALTTENVADTYAMHLIGMLSSLAYPPPPRAKSPDRPNPWVGFPRPSIRL